MKLEVGMYVRTKKGIAKVTYIDDLDNIALTDKKGIYFGVKRDNISLEWNVYDDGTVLKEPSFNPINLIEVGDYVNGYFVTDVYRPTGDEVFRIKIERDTLKGYIIDNCNQIETILTKEQFEDNCFRTGDK